MNKNRNRKNRNCLNFLYQDEKIRGRYFSPQEIKLIRKIVKTHYDKGRTYISKEICKALHWIQPNGWLKDRACRDVMRILERKGYIELPKLKNKKKQNKTFKLKTYKIVQNINTSQIDKLNFQLLIIKQVKGTREEAVWNDIVNKYHYLGFKVFVGRSLKYIIYYEDRIIAAIGFCDPAWSVTVRDELFKYLGVSIQQIRFRGINNGRFLILPWVNVPNLASHILSVAAKRIKEDWSKYYSVKPLFLETFVDPTKFKGICYKAANWIYLGKSKGYFKSGYYYHNNQTPKLMYLYPFDKTISSGLIKYFKEKTNAILN